MGTRTGKAPGRFNMRQGLWQGTRVLAGLSLLGVALTGCGVLAAQDGSAPAATVEGAASPEGPPPPSDARAPAGSPASPAATPGPTPVPTPGTGPRCPVLRCTSVVLTGDMAVDRALWEQAGKDAAAAGHSGTDLVPVLEGQRRYLDRSDLAVCHLNAPVGLPDGPFAARPSYNLPPQIIAAAKDIGYEACTTAGRHSADRASDGLLRTLDALDAAGVQHTGSYRTARESGEILILQAAATKVAVIAGTDRLNGRATEYPWQVDMLDPAAMVAKARKARELGADVVIGAMHAGDEFSAVPNARQKEVAHALADSGQFTLVYGHGSRSVLPLENHHGTWIAYGLGNGIAEVSARSVLNGEGLLLRVQFGQDAAGSWSVTDLAWAPTVMVPDPYRWCAVAADSPQGQCSGPEADAASRLRTVTVLESMGAAAAGAHELLITLEK
ncbi:CapA family protein [Pseudarthrobacter enclensis]|uniref:CapA family protein n=1 Tax=Pseudarthrobacter enclensis TaxID=993070 RepID=UPI003EE3BB89